MLIWHVVHSIPKLRGLKQLFHLISQFYEPRIQIGFSNSAPNFYIYIFFKSNCYKRLVNLFMNNFFKKSAPLCFY